MTRAWRNPARLMHTHISRRLISLTTQSYHHVFGTGSHCLGLEIYFAGLIPVKNVNYLQVYLSILFFHYYSINYPTKLNHVGDILQPASSVRSCPKSLRTHREKSTSLHRESHAGMESSK